MKYICKNCGADIDDTMAKCPYCDSMIPKGAEIAYMEKLYDIREDMEELKEIPQEVVKEELAGQGKRIRKIVTITMIVAGIIAALIVWNEKRYDRNYTDDLIWEQENFPIMSEMYENQEYEELEEFYIKAMMENRPVWNWEYDEEFSEWMEEQ